MSEKPVFCVYGVIMSVIAPGFYRYGLSRFEGGLMGLFNLLFSFRVRWRFSLGSLKLLIGWVMIFLLMGCGGLADLESVNNGEATPDLVDVLLPFPVEEVTQNWDVGEGVVLIERVVNRDRWFYLHGWRKDEALCIIFPEDSAVFLGREEDKLVFIGRGGYDTANYDFPYRLSFQLDTGSLAREEIYLPLTRSVAFGKIGWQQDLVGLEVGEKEVVFDFFPRQGEVLAGGQNYPLTTINYLEESGELVLRFFNVREMLRDWEGWEGGSRLPAAGIRELPGREAGRLDSALLGKGFPYGLLIADSSLVGDTATEIRLKTGEVQGYLVNINSSPGELGIRYVLRLESLDHISSSETSSIPVNPKD